MINISLKSREKLIELSKQKMTDSLSNQFLDFEPVYTQEATNAQTLLYNSSLKLTLHEYLTLDEQSRKTEEDKIFGGIGPTNEATQASNILKQSSVSLTLQEYESLAEQSKNPNFSETTIQGQEAQQILSKSTISMTLEQYQTLKEQENETENDPVFIGDTIPTNQAEKAKNILANNIFISDNQRVFTTDEIGKGTLEEQKDTVAKKQEEIIIDEPIIENDSPNIE